MNAPLRYRFRWSWSKLANAVQRIIPPRYYPDYILGALLGLIVLTIFLLLTGELKVLQPIKNNDTPPPIDVPPVDSLPPPVLTNLQRLTAAYPDFLAPSDSTNTIFWKTDSTYMRFDDGLEDKDFETLLNQPDLEDQMRMPYLKGQRVLNEKNLDPGRVRYEPFFKKMYGATREEVASKLDTVYWLPGSLNVPLLVTRVNGVNEKLRALSAELDTLEEYHKYLLKPGGTFNWRVIAGTDRLSMHSFGMTIDINVDYSNYWRWDQTQATNDYLGYRNRIPLALVVLFEKYGFIWGGKWYHYDTMHFEYRPELLLDPSGGAGEVE